VQRYEEVGKEQNKNKNFCCRALTKTILWRKNGIWAIEVPISTILKNSTKFGKGPATFMDSRSFEIRYDF
jgi:hypothetical protein